MKRPVPLVIPALLSVLALLLTGAAPAASTAERDRQSGSRPGTYSNPILPKVPGDGRVESCADPTVLRGQERGDRYWYMYCTTDPLNDEDLDDAGGLVFNRIPMMRSLDLVNWTYVGNAFPFGAAGLPSWAADDAALWAPDVVYSSTYDQYYLFVVVTQTDLGGNDPSGQPCSGDNAIGVAVSDSPTGPWEFSDQPVVGPRRGPGTCDFLWTFDPEVLGDRLGDEPGYFYYGSYYGGIFGDRITLDVNGATLAGSPTMVTIDNKYEGANVVRRGSWYYLFVSATNCCNGPLTGYSVYVGRSRDPFGPYVDREGNSLLDAQTGGTPVLSMNGNRWVGTGHNSVFRDFDGQWWTMYHAVDRGDPYFETDPGFTKRPAMLDPVDWIDGWPTVRGGRWASVERLPAPAAQPGQETRYRPRLVRPQLLGRTLAIDPFRGTELGSAWSWVREDAAGAWTVSDGVLRLPIQRTELYVDTNTAAVLVRNAPRGDYVVETKVRVDVPDEGCCFNYAQAGVLIRASDDAFVKLTNTSIWNTRQTEWAKEVATAPAEYPRYGNTVVGPPSEEWTYLRIVVERLSGAERRAALGDTERYTAYTSQDGRRWVRGGAWTHTLGRNAQIGLVAMGQQAGTEGDFTAEFDYVRVSSLRTGGGAWR